MAATNKLKHTVALASDIKPGERKLIEIDGRSIGVFNVNGTYHAIRNRCPHQGAPLCKGRVSGTTLPSKPGEYEWGRDGEIVSCPWHGWEFDITTGESVLNPHRMRVKAYEVTLEDGTTLGGEDPKVERFEVEVEGPYVVVHV